MSSVHTTSSFIDRESIIRILQTSQSLEWIAQKGEPLQDSSPASLSVPLELPYPKSIVDQFESIGLANPLARQLNEAYQLRAIDLREHIISQVQTTVSSRAQSTRRSLYNMVERMYLRTLSTWAQATLDDVKASLAEQHQQDQRSKSRPKFQKKWLPVFEFIYEQPNGKFPNRHDKIRLAQLTGMSYRQISVWFQNRRSRDKKEEIDIPFSNRRNSAGGSFTISDLFDDNGEDDESDSSSSDESSQDSDQENEDQWPIGMQSVAGPLDSFQRSTTAWPTCYIPGSGSFDPIPFITPWRRQNKQHLTPNATAPSTSSTHTSPSSSNTHSSAICEPIPPSLSETPTIPVYIPDIKNVLERLDRLKVSKKRRLTCQTSVRKSRPLITQPLPNSEEPANDPCSFTASPPALDPFLSPTPIGSRSRKITSSLSKKPYPHLAPGIAKLPVAAIRKAKAKRSGRSNSHFTVSSSSRSSRTYSCSDSSNSEHTCPSVSSASSPEPLPYELPDCEMGFSTGDPVSSGEELDITFGFEPTLAPRIDTACLSNSFSASLDRNVPTVTLEQLDTNVQIMTRDHYLFGLFDPMVNPTQIDEGAYMDFDSLLRLATPPSPEIVQSYPHPFTGIPEITLSQQMTPHDAFPASPTDFFQFLDSSSECSTTLSQDSPNGPWPAPFHTPDTTLPSIFATPDISPLHNLDFASWLNFSAVEAA